MADRRLQVFHAVAKQLSFTKAGEVLFLTQPAVSFQIKQLEEHFKTHLFDRSFGNISLTPAGETVLEYAESILGLNYELDVRIAEMTSQIGGPLLVGASTTIADYMLPRILGEFKSQYPLVRPRLVVANSETIETRVAEHTLDIGLIESPSHQSNLQCDDCCEDELLVICAPGSALAKLKEVTPQQLAAHPFVSREPGSGTREVTHDYFRAAGVPPDSLDVVIELGSPEAIKGVVETGIGFSIVSRALVTKEKRLGDLIALPLKPRLKRTLSMVYPKDKFRSRLINTFVEFAIARIKQSGLTRPEAPAALRR